MRTKGRCVTSCLVDMRRYLELLASCRRCFHTIAATNKYCVLYNPTVGQVSDLVLFQDRINVTLISGTSSTTNCSAPHSQQPVAKGGGHTRNANKGSVLQVWFVLQKWRRSVWRKVWAAGTTFSGHQSCVLTSCRQHRRSQPTRGSCQ